MIINAGTQSIATGADKQVTTAAPASKDQTAAIVDSDKPGSTIVTLSNGTKPHSGTYTADGIKKGPPESVIYEAGGIKKGPPETLIKD